MSSDLKPFLAHFRRRLRLQDGWRLIQNTLWIPTLFALLVQLGGRILPIERLDRWSLAAFPVWLLACLVWASFHPQPLMKVARRVDLVLSLRERLSTALVFESLPLSTDPVFTDLVRSQHRDAVATASAIAPSQALPLTWRPRPLAAACVLAVLVFLAAWLPNPMDTVLAQRQAVREEAARQAERVEQLRQQIEQAEELSPEEQADLLRRLAELAEKLHANRGDLEQAIADFSNLEKQLTDRLDPDAAAQQASLEALAAQLEALTGQLRDPNSTATDAAAQALADLATQLPGLNTEDQAELGRQLAQLASQVAQSGDADLAQALSALAQAAQQGDVQAAQQAAQAAQTALSQAQARLAGQNALQQAISQLQSGRQALSRASQQAAQAMAQSQNSGQNPGQGQTPGQNPGQTAGQAGAGQPSGNVTGGGSQASTLPPATGGRGNVRPRGQASNVAPDDLGSQVYAPWQRPAGSTGELTIPGLETGQGETQTRQGQSNLPGASNPALVPYQQVFNNYLSAANQALGQSYIPAGMTDYIRQYFSQLNP